MDDLQADLDRRYEEMLRRCNMNYFRPGDLDIPEEDEEEEGIEYCPDVYSSKPELGAGVRFERIRRITGYLVGDVSRWNNGKKAELKDRKFHG